MLLFYIIAKIKKFVLKYAKGEKKIMNIFLVRHGDDDERYRGGWSSLPLTQLGIEKAKKLADFLSNEQEDIKIDRIISSDLKRAKMTADIINEKLNVKIKYYERLRENNNGVLAGMLNEEAIKKFPNMYFSRLEYDERFPEGESPKEFYERIKEAFFSILNENNDVENLMLVTHAGVINIIYHIISNIEWSNKQKKLKIPKTSITKIVINNQDKQVCYVGITPHLNIQKSEE